MLEDKFSVATLVEQHHANNPDVTITIGKEHGKRQAEDLTVLSAPYYVGDMVGTVGILGPKRMDYEHAVRILHYMAGSLSSTLSIQN